MAASKSRRLNAGCGGRALASPYDVVSSVLAAALELFDARQFPGVAAVCAEALSDEPRDVGLRLLRARALLALRRDAAAQAEVSEILRIDPRCGGAHRLLGELAARRDEVQSARAFLREALRLAPGDEEATVWLAIVDAMGGPAVAADQFPAVAAAVGRRSPLAPLPPRAKRGTHPHVTPKPMLRVVPAVPIAAAPLPAVVPRASSTIAVVAAPVAAKGPPPIPVRALGRRTPPVPATTMAAAAAHVPVRRLATVRGTVPPPVATVRPSELYIGFGAYLVDVGVLSELQLRATLAYKKSTGVRLGAAACALGFATERRLESASLVYHGRHRKPSVADVIATARPERRDDSFAFRI